jgi:electron transport complex protein RnfB
VPSQTTTDAIDSLLPQTQCTRCGYQGCAPYAAAVASGAAINRCPPGGAETIARLAALLGREVLPLDPDCGAESAPTVAWIDADKCIGCARCLAPCPVDAIIGAQRLLHTIVDELCTGCELCIAACPVDCIHMLPRPAEGPRSIAPAAADNRQRYHGHVNRLQQQALAQQTLLAARKRAATLDPPA